MTVPKVRAWALLVFGLTSGIAAASAQGLTLPLVDLYTYAEDHGTLFGHHAKNVKHVATKDFMEQKILPLGIWTQAANETQKWQWEIHSPGGQSHLLVFSEVYLPDSGVLELCPPDEALGHCERYTPLTIPSSRQLVVPIIPGDRVRLQYTQQDPQHIPRLRLAAIMQGLQESLAQARLRLQSTRRRLQAATSAPGSAPGPGPRPGPAGPAGQPNAVLALGPTPPQQAQGTQFEIDSMQITSDDVSQCTPSVQCSSWHDEAAAVVAIYAVDMRLGAMGLCTGTVVNAPEGRKYLLTADHCFIDKQDISNFQWWMLIFNYEMPCRSTATPGPIRQVIQGTKLVFYDSKADVLLLDIPESIPDHFHAYKVGFDAAEDAPARAVAIHQPHGNIKRISYANDSSDIKTHFSAPVFSEDIHPTELTHYQVQWTQGATEPGSSGAALIDADTRKVVGVLTGGTTTCSIFSGADYFGKLSVAWSNGLQNFLSDAPSLQQSSSGLNAITQLHDGVVVVDSLGGSPVRVHGPAMNFWPTVFVLGPTDLTRIAFYLTDPPRANETITAQMSLRGDLPGNGFNPVKNITLSTTTFDFTTENCCTKAQPLVVSTNMGDSVPGDLVRFQVVFWLTSNTNSSYLHVSTVKGVVQSGFQAWNTLQPVACLNAPCSFRHPILDTAPPTYPLPTRAVFRYAPSRDIAVGQDICLQAGVLELSTVSVYINGTFTWTLSESYDQPDCVHIPALNVPAGIAMNTVVSDSDDYDAVLPLSVVKSINIYEGTKRVSSSPRGNAAAALVAAATQEGMASVAPALPPAASAGAPAGAQPALSAPAVSVAAAPTTSPAEAGSAGGGSSSDAGTGIGVDSPADSSQGVSGPASGQGIGSAGQAGQQGQGGQPRADSAAGGFVAGTGIGAASPDGMVSAASLQAPPPAQQKPGQGPSQGMARAPLGIMPNSGGASASTPTPDTAPTVVLAPSLPGSAFG